MDIWNPPRTHAGYLSQPTPVVGLCGGIQKGNIPQARLTQSKLTSSSIKQDRTRGHPHPCLMTLLRGMPPRCYISNVPKVSLRTTSLQLCSFRAFLSPQRQPAVTMSFVPSTLYYLSSAINAVSIPGHIAAGRRNLNPALQRLPSTPDVALGRISATVAWDMINALLATSGKRRLRCPRRSTYIE